LADGLVGLAAPEQDGAEVVVGIGIIRFQADGFLEFADVKLADGLFSLASYGEGDAAAEIVRGRPTWPSWRL